MNTANVPNASRESTTGDAVQIANILIRHDRLAQLDQSRTLASVSREDFLSGEITYQRVCGHPLILSLIAATMIWIGLLTVQGIVGWLIHGGRVHAYSIMMVLLFPAGGALLYQAWRQGTLLIVETRGGVRRHMEFKGNPSKESVIALERAAREHGFVLRLGSGPWH